MRFAFHAQGIHDAHLSHLPGGIGRQARLRVPRVHGAVGRIQHDPRRRRPFEARPGCLLNQTGARTLMPMACSRKSSSCSSMD
ncbi:hypothetical protein M8494_23205 [Serratia ureilytica]